MRIAFVGDVLLSNSAFDIGFGFFEKYQKEKSLDFLSEQTKVIFDKYDITIGNLEFCITDKTINNGLKSKPHRASSSISNEIKKLGIDYFSLANNHIMQHGVDGFNNTINNLEKNSVKFFGTNNKPYITLNNNQSRKIAIMSASTKFDPFIEYPEKYYFNVFPKQKLSKIEYEFLRKKYQDIYPNVINNIIEEDRDSFKFPTFKIRSSLENEITFYELMIDLYVQDIAQYSLFEKIKKVKETHDDIVLYLHWGDEYVSVPANWQVKLAEKLRSLGVTAIVGTHSHVIQGISDKDYTPTAFNLGNFIFNSNNPLASKGMLFSLTTNEHIWEYNYEIIEMGRKFNLYHICDDNYVQYLSRLINNIPVDKYVDYVKEGVNDSRKYKRNHLLSNLYKIPPITLLKVTFSYINRVVTRKLWN